MNTATGSLPSQPVTKATAMGEQPRTLREAVGVFTTAGDLQAAIDELLSSGFHRAELSLLAGADAVNEKLGGYANAGAVADNPVIPRTSYVSPEAIGDAQGGIIGGLAYAGATVAAGAVVVSGGDDRCRHRCGDVSRRSRRYYRLDPGKMAWRSPRTLSDDADRSWRPALMGANEGR